MKDYDDRDWSPQMRKWMRGLRPRKSRPFDPRNYSRSQNDPEIHKAPPLPRIGQSKTAWKIRDPTWSPQMRNWMTNAQQHGTPIRMMTQVRLSGVGNLIFRITDDGSIRVTDDDVTIRIIDFSTRVGS